MIEVHMLWDLLLQCVHFSPLIILGLLFLGGLNIPIPEELILFTSYLLVAQGHVPLYYMLPLVYLGVFLSDLMTFFIGKFLGYEALKLKMFNKSYLRKKIDKLHVYFDNYGPWTIIIGRFIPFGVRNAIFLTAGISKWDTKRFMMVDAIAVSLTVTSVYTICFFLQGYGKHLLVKAQLIVALLLLAGLLFVMYLRKK